MLRRASIGGAFFLVCYRCARQASRRARARRRAAAEAAPAALPPNLDALIESAVARRFVDERGAGAGVPVRRRRFALNAPAALDEERVPLRAAPEL